MKILFLHGWHSVPGGVKPTYLLQHGHEVINPALSDDDFEVAVRTAQDEFDKHRPHVIVASSRGGAIALNMKLDRIPLVLLCPAWKWWGNVHIAPPNATILHSRNDEVVPFAHSEELLTASHLPRTCLIETGTDHRLADPDSLQVMLQVCLRAHQED